MRLWRSNEFQSLIGVGSLRTQRTLCYIWWQWQQNPLKTINCQCTTACLTLQCSCKKYELACSSAGGSCQLSQCHNMPAYNLVDGITALDISTGPLARRTFQTAGPVRASTFHLSLARMGHLDICRPTRLQIVLARTMTNHSMYFSRGRPSHLGSFQAVLLIQRDASVSRVEWDMSIKHTDISV